MKDLQPKNVVLNAGSNDIGQNISSETYYANMQSILNTVSSWPSVDHIYVYKILPNNAMSVQNIQDRWIPWNNWIADLPRTYPKVIVVDATGTV